MTAPTSTDRLRPDRVADASTLPEGTRVLVAGSDHLHGAVATVTRSGLADAYTASCDAVAALEDGQ